MAGMGEQTNRGRTARDWVLLIALGLLVAALAAPLNGGVAVVGLVIAVCGGLGLVWRLVGDR